MNSYTLLGILYFSLVISACCKEAQSDLAGCCGNQAIDQAVGNGHVYIPNIFTPDGDGINDQFTVFGDSIRFISNFRIRDKNEILVFNMTLDPLNNPSAGWDGKVNGVVTKGIYSYTLWAEAENGVVQVIEGEVCNYPCNDLEAGEHISGDNCQFPSQTEDGHFNPLFPSGESGNCFE